MGSSPVPFERAHLYSWIAVDKQIDNANYSLLIKYFPSLPTCQQHLKKHFIERQIFIQINHSPFALRFQVISVDDIPPPIIQIGPTNQTLPKGSVALLSCRAAGNPAPEIKWTKDGASLPSRSRFVIVQSGTLKIDGKIVSFFPQNSAN